MDLRIPLKYLLKLVFIFELVLLGVTASVCDASNISIVALLLGLMTCVRKENTLCLIFASSCLFYRIPNGIPISIVFIVFYVLQSLFVPHRKDENRLKLKRVIILLLSIGYIYVSCLTSLTGSFSRFIPYVLFFLFVYSCDNTYQINIAKFQENLFLSCCVVVPCILLTQLIHPVYLGTRVTISKEFNCNQLARNIVMTVPVFMLFIWRYRKYWAFIFVFVAILSVVLTGSRTSLLALFTTFCIMLMIFKKRKALLLLVLSGIIISMTYSVLITSEYSRVAEISDKAVSEDLRLISSAILIDKVIKPNLLFGIGLGNENTEKVLGFISDSDNFFIDSISQVGLIGFFALAYLLIYSIKSIVKLKNRAHNKFISFLPLSFMVVQLCYIMTETCFDEITFWYAIAVSMIYKNINYDTRRPPCYIHSSSKFQ